MVHISSRLILTDGPSVGPTCESIHPNPTHYMDRFEDSLSPSRLWAIVQGGHIGQGCGVIAAGNSLYFDGEGRREARTVSLDVSQIK